MTDYTKAEEDFALERGCTLPQARDILQRNAAPPQAFPREAVIGDNSGAVVTSPDAETLTNAAREKLKQVVARVERLEEEKKEIAGQIKDVYGEAKSMGYDTKAIRTLVRLRKRDAQDLKEEQAILDVYAEALGMEFYD